MDKPKIEATLRALSAVLTGSRMSAEDALNCVSELHAMTVLSVCGPGWREVDCHELLNRCTESSHEYINSNWREAQIAARKVAERSR